MSNEKMVIPFNAPINEKDTEIQTYGCRQSNPDICGNNNTPNICAFVREDCICKKPSRSWKKKYIMLSNKHI